METLVSNYLLIFAVLVVLNIVFGFANQILKMQNRKLEDKLKKLIKERNN